jgi:pimeloyl-ACP methyl ester carboxylesterase
MEFITSSDHTSIACQRSGKGPPLILVHGAGGDHSRWSALTEHIRDDFTVYAMDRRGRSDSGDADTYSMEREFDDIAAVASSIEGPVNLYGHSSGALYALEAARKIPKLQRLVLYEPPRPGGGQLAPQSVVDELQSLIEQGKPEDALILFMREVARFPEDEIATYRTLPTWPARVAAAHTLPRELDDIHSYQAALERFSDLHVPTLLLLGESTAPIFQHATQMLDATLPDSRVHSLAGQGHAADVMAPELVASALREFLLDS